MGWASRLLDFCIKRLPGHSKDFCTMWSNRKMISQLPALLLLPELLPVFFKVHPAEIFCPGKSLYHTCYFFLKSSLLVLPLHSRNPISIHCIARNILRSIEADVYHLDNSCSESLSLSSGCSYFPDQNIRSSGSDRETDLCWGSIWPPPSADGPIGNL